MTSKDYVGRLFRKEPKRLLILNHPIVWFEEDELGGWNRLQLKMQLNNLVFDGGLTHKGPGAMKDHLKDLAKLSKNQGATDVRVPKRAHRFAELVKILEDKGIFEKCDFNEDDEVVNELKMQHLNEINNLRNHESLAEVSDNSGEEQKHILEDIVNATINSEIGLAYTQESSITEERSPSKKLVFNNKTDLPEDPKGVDIPPVPSASSRQIDQAMYATMEAELLKSRDIISNLKSEVSQLKKKCLELENRLATEEYDITADVQAAVSQGIDQKLKDFETKLTASLVTEMTAVYTKRDNKVAKDSSILQETKTAVDETFKRAHSTSICLPDFAKAMGLSISKTNTLNEKVQAHGKTLTQIRTKLNATVELVKEALKRQSGIASDCNGSDNTAYDGSSLPPTPSTPNPPTCSECHKIGHFGINCPVRLEFCARCLSRDHEVYECPSIRDPCQSCLDSGYGKLSFGHTEQIHYVEEPDKRELIAEYISRVCLSDWDLGSKRMRYEN